MTSHSTSNSDPTDCLSRRVGAALIDAIVTMVVLGLLGFIFGVSLDGGNPAAFLALVALATVYICAVFGVYQGMSGMTPGKAASGVRTVNKYGAPPGPPKALMRTAIGFFEMAFGIFPIGVIVMFLSNGHRRVGDMVANTWVVRLEYMGTSPLPDQPTAVLDQFIAPDRAGQPMARADSQSNDATPRPLPSPPPLGVEPTPQWDEHRSCYIQWDKTLERWMQYLESTQRWTPLEE